MKGVRSITKLMAFEMDVASAAPATPMPIFMMKSGSKARLIMQPETMPIME